MVLSFSSAGTIFVFFVFMEVTEFRLQSKLGRAHSHESIYLGRVMRGGGEGEGVGFPTHPYEEGRM